MKDVVRTLKIDLPQRQSAFLWGPRKTGKSTFLRQAFPHSLVYDFLRKDVYLEVVKNPSLLREKILAQDAAVLKHPIILDEVQKVPEILDEVHWMIGNKGLRFILCGSSARKLKRGQANLLGGRAWRFELFPLVSSELEHIDLLRTLSHGLLPAHYLQENAARSIKAYVQDYLKEEVFEEGIVRNIPAFLRFFDAMAYSLGEMVNYSNVSRDCGVDSKTVKEYYQILADMLLGSFVEPYKKRQSRDVILKAPKFYFFDVGVAAAIAKHPVLEARGEFFGRALENFIFMELTAYRSYRERDFSINYWRTKTGLEVDFILDDGRVAIEVKGASRVDKTELSGLKAFMEEYQPSKALVVSNERELRVTSGGIQVIPWRDFLSRLWRGEIV
ncbi:MAG: ATP-binding protein [Candidatus Omnitrophica bacterium]|nr:ATP-binding protein [Candidatus Omnitrophota bacterium]